MGIFASHPNQLVGDSTIAIIESSNLGIKLLVAPTAQDRNSIPWSPGYPW